MFRSVVWLIQKPTMVTYFHYQILCVIQNPCAKLLYDCQCSMHVNTQHTQTGEQCTVLTSHQLQRYRAIGIFSSIVLWDHQGTYCLSSTKHHCIAHDYVSCRLIALNLQSEYNLIVITEFICPVGIITPIIFQIPGSLYFSQHFASPGGLSKSLL